MIISTDFDKLSFHDASIEKIDRTNDEIHISFEGGVVGKKHPDAHNCEWVIERGILKLLGVSNEEAKYWDDTKQGKPHPSPQLPLDEIMSVSFDGEIFTFEGFLETQPWYEWFVKGNGFELEVLSKHEFNS